MEILLAVLLLVIALMLVFLIYYIKQITGKLEGHQDILNEVKNSESLENVLQEKFSEQEKTLNRIEKSDRLETLTVQLKNISKSLSVFESENESTEQWLEAIENPSDDINKLELLEAAANRFPSEKRFIERIREILQPLIEEGDNLLVKREALMRLRNHANRFSENCPISDFEYANRFKNEVIDSMENVVKRIGDLREENLEKQIADLEKRINKLKKSSKKNELLEGIEKVDEKIDQSVLGNYPKLNSKYEELSKELITELNESEKESKKDLKKYNEDVLQKAKKAIKSINNHSEGNVKDKFFGPDKPVNYNQKKNLTKLLKLIANHDTDKLHPSVSNYVRMAEAEIFNKLSPNGRILFTELMIKEAYK